MDVMIVARHPSGGIRTYFRYVYRDDVMKDLGVTLLTPPTDSRTFFEEAFPVRSFRHVECEATTSSLLKAVWRLVSQRRPDIIHSHGFTAGIVSAIPARLFRVPHILTTHDVFFPEQFAGARGRIKQRFIGQVMSQVDVLNPVGEDACNNLRQMFPRLEVKTRLRPIRNGIDARLFRTDEVRLVRAELGVADESILLGFFGRFMGQKGFGLLRDAVADLNDQNNGPRFEVACFGWGGFIREEQALLRERKIDAYFHFLPGTDDMAPSLRGVDAAVMPSRWEACPLLPMEAMVAGTIVVASDCIGMHEVTQETPALTFPTGDIESLKDKLLQVASRKDELRRSAESFRTVAAERFDASETASAVRRLYNDLVERATHRLSPQPKRDADAR